MTPMSATRDEAIRWRDQVWAQLQDPEHPPFVASLPGLFILGGDHTDSDYCWCQPSLELHGCGHRHGLHRREMD